MALLFSYGTLQQPAVQQSTFGRRLHGTPAVLLGFLLDVLRVDDERFVAESGSAEHAIVRFTGRSDDRVPGMALEVTEDELARSDAYEPAGYVRMRGAIESGQQVWVYAAAQTGDEAIRFEWATAQDVPAMERCRAVDPEVGPADPRMAAYLNGTHHPQQALSARTALVAMSGADVVGYIAGHATTRFDCAGEVQYLYVAPAFRRRGVAKGMLRRLASWFAAQQIDRVCVNVNPDSQGAAPFYRRLGATPINAHWCIWQDIGALREDVT